MVLEALFRKLKIFFNAWISDKALRAQMNITQSSICSKALSLFDWLKEMKDDTKEIFVASEDGLIIFKIDMASIL